MDDEVAVRMYEAVRGSAERVRSLGVCDRSPCGDLSGGHIDRDRLLFGFAPANLLARLEVNTTLKDGAVSTTEPGGRRLSMLLVVVETALAVMLLAGAG